MAAFIVGFASESVLAIEIRPNRVVAMLDALGIRSAHGFGQSLGGGVLLRAAIERPCLFESLMICEGTATPTHSAPREARARRRTEGPARIQTVWKEKQELISHYSQKRPFPGCMRATPDSSSLYFS